VVALALVVEWAWIWLLMTSEVVALMREADASAQGSFDLVVLAYAVSVEFQGAHGSSGVVELAAAEAAAEAAEVQGAQGSSELLALTKVDSVEPQGSSEAVFSTNVDSVESHGSVVPWASAFERPS